jgi:hypothetical protein
MTAGQNHAVRIFCATLALVLSIALGAPASAEGRWQATVFAGTMTENEWEKVFDPSQLKFAGSNLIGLAAGWDRPIGDSRYSIGFEVQAVGHFGRQDHLEFNLPLVVRYTPPQPRRFRFKSAAFGIGPSHATKVPQVEIDRTGASLRNLIYWMAELEFVTGCPDQSLYFRLHHRSDGFGLYPVSSGSTGLVLGWRRSF